MLSEAMIGVAKNQKVRITLSTWAVSLRKTWRLATIHPTPTARRPVTSMYIGRKTRKMLTWLRKMAAAPIMRARASRWLTRDDRNTETGTISAGKTVLVIRLAWSSRLEAERCTVSLNRNQGSIPAN